MTYKILKSNEEWRKILPDSLYRVAREKGTERPFSGKYVETTESGQYRCACCSAELFHSATKFDAGCGWPSFYAAATPEAVAEHHDSSHGMERTEVTCANCGAHLGHVFPDGPPETGLRYCINSISLDLKPQE